MSHGHRGLAPVPSSLPGLLALRFAALAVDHEDRIDAICCSVGSDRASSSGSALGKRRAASRGHWGLSSDHSARLSLIALSRLLRTQDEGLLAHVAASPIGAALLDALRAAVLRVAIAAGGADVGLTATSVDTLFNMSGSTFASASRYNASSLTLPSRLPFASAKALLRALLDSLAAALLVEEVGSLVALLRILPPRPLEETAHAAIAALIATVEADSTRRLQAGVGGSSSSSSTRSAQPLSMGPPPLLPLPLPQPQPPPPPMTPFLLDASISLASNARRRVEARLARPMTTAEAEALDAALVEALGILRVGSSADHRAVLQSNTLAALAVPEAAQVWASALDEADRVFSSVADYAAAVVAAVETIANSLLEKAFGL